MLQAAERSVEVDRTAAVRARLALGYFALVGVLGLLLRWLLVQPINGINYKFLLHGHSHVALLGWLYCAFFAALLYAFPPQSIAAQKSFKRQFLLTQVSVAGMLVTFPIQGYALFSITFSTLHILLSYWFGWSFWKHLKGYVQQEGRYQVPVKYIGASLLFLVLSTIGPWSLGPIMAKGLSGSELYYSAIYFYLHFQYNGWFTFAVLGLFLWWLEHNNLYFNKQLATRAFWFLALACVPAFALSVLWTKPAVWVYVTGGVAGLMQLAGLYFILRSILEVWPELVALLKPWVRRLLGLALVALVLKLVLQAASALPFVADLAYQFRYFIIGYLHLSLIGFVSLFMLGFFLQQDLFRFGKYGKGGLSLLLAGFFLSESLLFLQGTFLWLNLPAIPSFNQLMFWVSIPMPVGLLLLFFSQRGLYLSRSNTSKAAVKTLSPAEN
ncbi:hypothetical protein [Pontibacter ruber]|uniref:Uncharacterized protein n=1 Tax=Pontibacter ruber TaxID=1343895 RepID=A0ABW5CT02_9BACT|nr:hypothetical protein [Pontibacter ruber]